MAEVVLVEAAETFTHVAARGMLDEVGVGEFNLRLLTQRRRPAIVDLNGVGVITSLGIGTLVSVVKSMRSLDLGIVFLVGPTHVRKVLEATSIGKLVPLVATREEALATLGLTESSAS
jgi:anti-anti-sigma factor